jgi:two-component system NtrC family sensor kinase
MTPEQTNGAKQVTDMRSLGHAVAGASPMPMAELEGSTHIIRYANPAFCLLAGKSKEELLGKDFSDATPVWKECLALLRKVYRTGRSDAHTGHEHSVSHPLYWSYVMWPVLAPDNRTLGVIIQVTETTSFHQDAVAMNQALLIGSVRQHELTEAAESLAARLQGEIIARKKAEEALIVSEKLASTGRMAAVLAHEINNPIGAVMDILYLAQTTEGLPDSVAGYLEIADGELKRIAHITRQTLGFYRESVEPTTFPIVLLLDSVLDLLQAKIRSTGADVRRQCNAKLQITAMHGELRQVLSNLLLNGLDAIGVNGKVVLRASTSTDSKNGSQRVRVSVADNGRGIGADTLRQIFEPFFTTKGELGNGLGLWVSKQIIEKHQGSIRVRSCTAGPHRGTTFSVVVPLSIDSI